MPRFTTISAAGCIALMLGTGAVLAAANLPPCEKDKPIPAGGCMAPKDPVTPLEKLRPAPPLTVPPGVTPPGTSGAIPPPIADSPSVVVPPPTGDNIVKPTPPADPKMPVVKPPADVTPKI